MPDQPDSEELGSEQPEPEQPGKMSPDFLKREVLSKLGAPASEVLVPPRIGTDFTALDLGHERVLVASTDPVYVPLQFGTRLGAWFALQILVADVLVSGIAPRYLSISLQFPPTTPGALIAEIWDAIHAECRALEVSVVTGHTGRYAGCAFPTVGAATVFGVGARAALVSPADLAPGDVLLVTAGFGVEAAVSLAFRDANPAWTRGHASPTRVREGLGSWDPRIDPPDVPAHFRDLSIVPEARCLLALPGRKTAITALHDVAEGGIIGAVFELVGGRDLGALLDEGPPRTPRNPPAIASVLAQYGLDPWSSSSQGSLLVACRPGALQRIETALTTAGIFHHRLGVVEARPGVRIKERTGERELAEPPPDRFWEVYAGPSKPAHEGR